MPLLFLLFFLSTNALARASIEDSIREIIEADSPGIFRSQRMDSYIPDALASQTIFELMGPAQTPIVEGSSEPLLDACRLHSCVEKLGAIVDLNRRVILGLALHHYHCHDGSAGVSQGSAGSASRAVECDKTPTNTIFIVQRPGVTEATESGTLQRLRAWAASKGDGREKLHFIRML
ncbi:hypothetical protein [Massilia horti]|uniref:Uncharacterized protein n=1 Tax=Massilia horti TaxID=2562153 RepID=A0A4Y9SQQ1_9BURK|nr:hypothetical protein [Massilia horti]TFW29102.1 hypothetical protein E4O92_19555 [Massilia horti]